MKKFLSLLLVLNFAFTLVACGNEKDTIIESDISTQSQTENSNVTQTNDGNIIDGNSVDIEKPNNTNPTTSNHATTKPTTSKPITSKPSTTTPTKNNEDDIPSTDDRPTSTHTHFYSKTTVKPTCTEKGYTTYTCSCGDTYNSNYIYPAHKYKKNVCTVCGIKHENYYLYENEYNKLTADYNAEVSKFEAKIRESNKNIEDCQDAINNARGSLFSLSPTCPQWYIQEYVNNWQGYGDSYAATQAAKNAWSQEYNSQKTQLNNIISMNTSKMQAEQSNVRLYKSCISTLTTQYNRDVTALKIKYDMY